MGLKVAGIGTAVPRFCFSQAEAAEVSKSFCCESAEKLRLIPTLYRRAAVKKRHSVLLERANGDLFSRQSFYQRASSRDDGGPSTLARMARYEGEAPPLAVAAARQALADSGLKAASITHSVTVSCTGFHAPGIDAALIKQLGLDPTVERTHVGFMGCHGAFNGVRLAASFVNADPAARVLVSAVELCTLHFCYGWNTEMIVANSLFADGAGAVIGVAANGRQDADSWRVDANGTFLMPGSEDAMSWRIGDHGFQMTLSPRVPELIREHVPAWLEKWLNGRGLDIGSIASWAVHPGGPRILGAFADAVGLGKEELAVSREVLAEFGNMSSATVLFILERMRRQGAQRPCVAVGFGPGMVVETLLLA